MPRKPFSAPPKPRGPVGIRLVSPALVGVWRKMVIQFARRPKGLEPNLKDDLLVQAIARQERANIYELWQAFTTDRENLPRYLMDPKRQTVAYLLGFHLPNVVRTRLALERAAERHHLRGALLASERGLKIVDLGAGTGAVTQGIIDFLGVKGAEKTVKTIELVDAIGAFLDAARAGLEALGFGPAIQGRKGRIERVLTDVAADDGEAERKTTIIGLGYVWNELAANPAARKRLLSYLHAQGGEERETLIVVVEPANQNLARDTQGLRDELVATGYQVLYPCPHQEGCPMLERSRDWCYSEATWDAPREILAVDKLLEIDRTFIKSGIYVFASPALAARMKPGRAAPAVVVGRPIRKTAPHKGPARAPQVDYLLCQDNAELGTKPGKRSGPPLSRGQIFDAP